MRIEKDSLGELPVPDQAYYGIQTLRGSQNFQISGTQVHPELIRSYLLLKRAAAKANLKVKALSPETSNAIVAAVDDLLKGNFQSHFIIDAYQAGAGTSQNMNANEVIANLANELLGHPLGSYTPVHPNDHVNCSQSTNDTYPTVMRLSALVLSQLLLKELTQLSESLGKKALEFDDILKSGRTHLQDAVPIRLGQEFAAYQATVTELSTLLEQSQEYLRNLGIGGSAAGTGINVPVGYTDAILQELKILFHDPKLLRVKNKCAAMQSQLPITVYSHALKAIALELTRIFNDLRLLSSGPSAGLAEIVLPSSQPGSSIMPGKVNPSLLEMGNQVCFKVLGNDSALSYAMQAGQLELNVMMPVMAQVVLESTHILTHALRTVRERCIDGIQANRERCLAYAEHSTQIVTALNPIIGYARAAEIAKDAIAQNKSVVDIVREKNILNEIQIKSLLNPRTLTESGE